MKTLLWLLGGLIFITCSNNNIKELKLWYYQPANASEPDNGNAWVNEAEWLKAFPLGNGSLGVMVYGDVNKERIQLNEKSMWSGSLTDNNNPEAYHSVSKIRELLWEGKYKEAAELTQKTQVCKGVGSGYGSGSNAPYGCYQTLGNLWIDFGKKSPYSNYKRELDLNNAVSRIRYSQDRIKYEREIFVSYPAKAIVMRFSANKKGNISFKCTLNRPEKYKTVSENNHLMMKGRLVDGKGAEGMSYCTRLKVLNSGGEVVYSDSSVQVSSADEVVIIITANTNYRMQYPDYKEDDFELISAENLEKASVKSYKELLTEHVEDYSNLFNRTTFSLSNKYADTIPSDRLLSNFRQSQFDSHLYELYFQYGRYLLISSSREGTLPANLQGLWTNKIQTPWNCDYHTNINVQMNYWPAEVTNLSELHFQLIDFIKELEKPGTKTAQVHYNAGGWCIHPITNVWGFTAPGEGSDWGLHLGAGGWLCQHLWEHYAFTLDTAYLKTVFPVMKNSAAFYLDWLVSDPQTGKLVSGPAGSPENSFIAPDGSRCQISMGPSHDQEIIWELFTNVVNAAEILNSKDSVIEKIVKAKSKLLLPSIAKDGRLMEWAQDFREYEPGHRHVSHLYAVHPGNMINCSTPELMKAAQKSLEYRLSHGGGHTGWSAAWMINLWARFRDGDKALDAVNKVLTQSTAENLFDMHAPFQIDGNFGSTAGIAEMLLQSHEGFLVILPALPNHWPNGEIKGICARGSFIVDIQWEKGELKNLRIYSIKGSRLKAVYKDKFIDIETKPGQEYRFNNSLKL